jgi:hypothetical protein
VGFPEDVLPIFAITASGLTETETDARHRRRHAWAARTM